jgi:Methyltransferase domain
MTLRAAGALAAEPVDAQAAWRELLDAATQPYRASGRFGWHFARGKLGRDPVFRYLVERGLFVPPHEQEPPRSLRSLPPEGTGSGFGRPGATAGPVRVLDIGSGQSLIASLVHQMRRLHAARRWPIEWPAPPADELRYTGIELMPKDIARARAALAHLPVAPVLVNGNMCEVEYPPSDLVVILDVLHYVDIAAQDHVLERVHACLRAGGGRLLLRIGDQDSARGFAASQWVDRIVTNIRGHRAPPTWGRPLKDWIAKLEAIGFAVQAVPKSEGTPFANVLLVAQRG